MATSRNTATSSSGFSTLATGVPTEGNDVLSGSGSDTVDGLGGNDYITGNTGGQVLIGGAGNDTLEGLWGPDTLVGGRDDDLYIMGPYSGTDIIDNYDTNPNKYDVVYLKGIDESKLTGFQRLGNDLLISWGQDLSFTLKDAYLGIEHQITALRMYKFLSTSEEVYIPMQDLFERYTISLTDGDDILGPSDLSEHINAAAGNDFIQMGAGNDVVTGGTGNDTLDGGTGNDMLYGGAGDDVIILRKGDGIDTLSASDTTAGRVDIIRFEDVSSDGLTGVLYRGGHLVLQYGAGDEITVQQHFAGPNSGITHVQFSDGETLSMAELFARYPISLSSGNDTATFTLNMSETVLGGTGNDIISTYGNHDTVYGDSGNDTLNGGDGNDLVVGGDGTDSLEGGLDNDTLQGGDGNDVLLGQSGNDSLEGGQGHDTLNGDYGDDTLDGGTGNDSLIGSVGADTFILRTGSGTDRISFATTSGTAADTIRFEDIASGDIAAVTRIQGDLKISYGAGDSVTIEAFYANSVYFKGFEFADGVSLTSAQLFALYPITLGSGGDNVSFTSAAETVYGGAGNDSVLGLDGNDVLYGEADNDTLNGGAGNDTLVGGDGNDILLGDAGDDRLDGGAGNDTYTAGAGNDTIVLRIGSGVDTVTVADSTAGRIDTLQFEDVAFTELTGVQRVTSNLVLSYGNGDQVTILNHFSGAANEISKIQFSDGTSVTVSELLSAYPITLTPTADTVAFAGNTNETVYAGAGNDSVDVKGGHDKLYGEDGNDTLTGGDGNDLLVGGAGADSLQGGLDNDTLQGGEGNDVLLGEGGDDSLQGGQEHDTLNGGIGDDTLDGGAGNDSLIGSVGADTFILRTGSGADRISFATTSGTGADTIRFEDIGSNDIAAVTRTTGHLVIHYGAGDSVTIEDFYANSVYFKGFEFADGMSLSSAELFARYPVTLGSGPDNVTFTAAGETVYGGVGNDTVFGVDGNDALYGEADNDSLSGGAGNDTLSGDAGRDTLIGDLGDDLLSGGLDIDSLLGGAGNDTLDGGAGNDSMTGGTGNDLYLLRVGSGVDAIDLSDTSTLKNKVIRFEDVDAGELLAVKRSGTNLVIEYGNGDSVSLTNFYGTAKFNTIEFADGMTFDQDLLFANYAVRMGATPETGTFTDSAETVYGGVGNDTIIAAGGDDVVFGEADNDSLLGGAGNDTLYGGSGNDQINGDAGDDKLEGGTGNDTITSNSGNDTIVFHVGDGLDVLNINDATAGRVKSLLFDGIGGMDLVSLQRVAGDLLMNYGAGDQVKIGSYLSANAAIQTLKFTDVEWTMQDLYNNHAINLGSAGENLVFGAFGEWVQAGAGNDIIDGGAGDDRLFGELGNDSLTGNTGADELGGGDGLDTLAGGAGDDKLYGDAGADLIRGDADNDWIDGGADNDNLSGDAGNDVLLGGDGNDTLNGGVGNDTMYGGAGNDSFTGAAGDDIYVLQLGSGIDTISAYDTTAARFESLVLENVEIGQVTSVAKVSNNLVITYGTSDQVTVTNHFLGAAYALNAVQFSDGINHTVAELMALFTGTAAMAATDHAAVIGSQPEFFV